jgi:hypothetical protein
MVPQVNEVSKDGSNLDLEGLESLDEVGFAFLHGFAGS